MALTATASRGFEFDRYLTPGEIFLLPGDPGATFDPGDTVDFTNGVLTRTTKGDQPLWVVEAGGQIVTPSATSYGFGVPTLDTGFFKGSVDTGMSVYVPCRFMGPAIPIFTCTFASHHDDTVAAYTASTRTITLTVSTGADNDCNGGICYIHTGTGAGQWNVVESYTHASLALVTHRKWETAPSTDSEIIILEGEGAAGDGIGFGGYVTSGDHDNLVVNDGQNDGEWVVMMDAFEVPQLLSELKLKVAPSRYFQ